MAFIEGCIAAWQIFDAHRGAQGRAQPT
jgi:hypothetical protein